MSSKYNHMVLALFCLFLFISSCTGTSDHSKDIEAVENGLTPMVQIKDSVVHYSIEDRMEHFNVPGVSIALLDNGKIQWAKGYGIANTQNNRTVNSNTLFQAGSISKPLAALSVLKLAEEDRLDLDANVNRYLEDWKLPENKFTEDSSVTPRKLLTHTAGTTVHGFPGYARSDTMPTITAVLDGKGNTPAVRVDTTPGARWSYSGGGYTVLEKVVEDVTDMPLDEYMAREILRPMDMSNSTYEQPLPEDKYQYASAAYDQKGELIEGLWHNYPQQAAAGLWTTPSDLLKYCSEIQNIHAGKTDGILKPATVNSMLTKHKNNWGLGPQLKGASDSLRFQHGGKNAGFSNMMTCFANKGSGVVVMTNADNGVNLMNEIIYSVSDHYNWGIAEPKVVEKANLSINELKQFTGRYELSKEQVKQKPNIQINLKDGNLFFYDVTDELTIKLIPISQNKFIAPAYDVPFEFSMATDTSQATVTINGNNKFIKIENS